MIHFSSVCVSQSTTDSLVSDKNAAQCIQNHDVYLSQMYLQIHMIERVCSRLVTDWILCRSSWFVL